MATALYKINCPNPDHQDDTASCAVYPGGDAWCFGCATYFKEVAKPADIETKSKEDMLATINHILTLPRQVIRGVELHYDDQGYYIIWPDHSYYKFRYWADNNSRYRSPTGHSPTLYFATPVYDFANTLHIVEGELNSLSLNYLSPNKNQVIISPGSAMQFIKTAMLNYLPKLTKYVKVNIWVDADKAGIEAAVKLKIIAIQHNPNIEIHLLNKDFNDYLVGTEDDKEEIRYRIKKSMGV